MFALFMLSLIDCQASVAPCIYSPYTIYILKPKSRRFVTTKKNSAVSVFTAAGLNSKVVNSIARKTGFSKRGGGKIDATDFITHFCAESTRGTVSNNDLAATLNSETDVSVSRQACWDRIDNECLLFFQAILEVLILSKLEKKTRTLCPFFKRILIQDSTIIQLPARLFDAFSGVKNATTTTCNARIQGIYDLCSGRFTHFSIDPYSKNDLSVASDIQTEPGDLIIRDRGYFIIGTMVEKKQNGADTISRYKHKTLFYDVQTKEEIDLLDILTRHGEVDMFVLAGTNMDMQVRLLAKPVSEEVANMRRMKAKKENKRFTLSKEVLALMSWAIFITTIENIAITITEIMNLYGLRWRIENIFKTWKSYFNFAKIHQVSEIHLRILLTARLIMISICFHNAYVPMCDAIRCHTSKQLSMMKFMRYIL